MKVYGDRICRWCNGLCSVNSWRRNYGTRKSYFCCETCLRQYLNSELRKGCKESGVKSWANVRYSTSDFLQTRKEFYEKVDVIQGRNT